MPELTYPTHDVILYLEALESRLAGILPLAAGSNAWRFLHGLREELRQEIAAGWEGLNQMAEEMMAEGLREQGDPLEEMR
jgi:hypothetical protein